METDELWLRGVIAEELQDLLLASSRAIDSSICSCRSRPLVIVAIWAGTSGLRASIPRSCARGKAMSALTFIVRSRSSAWV